MYTAVDGDGNIYHEVKKVFTEEYFVSLEAIILNDIKKGNK
jgi:hypothetical protein